MFKMSKHEKKTFKEASSCLTSIKWFATIPFFQLCKVIFQEENKSNKIVKC